MRNIIRLLFLTVLMIIINDQYQIQATYDKMRDACYNISVLIAEKNGLSRELISYVEQLDFEFCYDENNSRIDGSIVYYRLTGKVKLALNLDKKIIIYESVILGSL